MRKEDIVVPHGETRRTFQGTPCFAQEKIAFDSGYREGYFDATTKQSAVGRTEMLISFFLWFRANGELHLDKSIEEMISVYGEETDALITDLK